MSKMKQLFKGYHNNKSDGRFFVVFVVITPVSSAGAKKKKIPKQTSLNSIPTDWSKDWHQLLSQITQHQPVWTVTWISVRSVTFCLLVWDWTSVWGCVCTCVCVSSLNSWEMFNKQNKKKPDVRLSGECRCYTRVRLPDVYQWVMVLFQFIKRSLHTSHIYPAVLCSICDTDTDDIEMKKLSSSWTGLEVRRSEGH